MDPHILRSINSDKLVNVAAIRDPDKFKALSGVLEATEFFGKLDGAGNNREGKRELRHYRQAKLHVHVFDEGSFNLHRSELVEYLINASMSEDTGTLP